MLSKWPLKLCCSTGDGGRGSQRYHTQNGTVLFSVGLHASHLHVLCITVLIDASTAKPLEALYINERDWFNIQSLLTKDNDVTWIYISFSLNINYRVSHVLFVMSLIVVCFSVSFLLCASLCLRVILYVSLSRIYIFLISVYREYIYLIFPIVFLYIDYKTDVSLTAHFFPGHTF